MNKSKRQSKSASKQQDEPQPMEVDVNDDDLNLFEDEEGLFDNIFKIVQFFNIFKKNFRWNSSWRYLYTPSSTASLFFRQ